MAKKVFIKGEKLFFTEGKAFKEFVRRRYRYESLTHNGALLCVDPAQEDVKASVYYPLHFDISGTACCVSTRDDISAIVNHLEEWGLEFLGASIDDRTGRILLFGYLPVEPGLVYISELGQVHLMMVYKVSSSSRREILAELKNAMKQKQRPQAAASAVNWDSLVKSIEEGANSSKVFEQNKGAIASVLDTLLKLFDETARSERGDTSKKSTPPIPPTIKEKLEKVKLLQNVTAPLSIKEEEVETDTEEEGD